MDLINQINTQIEEHCQSGGDYELYVYPFYQQTEFGWKINKIKSETITPDIIYKEYVFRDSVRREYMNSNAKTRIYRVRRYVYEIKSMLCVINLIKYISDNMMPYLIQYHAEYTRKIKYVEKKHNYDIIKISDNDEPYFAFKVNKLSETTIRELNALQTKIKPQE